MLCSDLPMSHCKLLHSNGSLILDDKSVSESFAFICFRLDVKEKVSLCRHEFPNSARNGQLLQEIFEYQQGEVRRGQPVGAETWVIRLWFPLVWKINLFLSIIHQNVKEF
jgi:hypothetical protein